MEGTKKEVYTLTETYKDNDAEVIGAYDSRYAMVKGFAKHLACEVVQDELGLKNSESKEAKKIRKIAKKVAVVLSDLIPSILGVEDWGRDEEGCCRYGKSVFGYDTMPLECAGDGDDEEDEVDDE